ncbi:MAG: KamA family radical SAM protein, partial [Candidatus Latescibacteria bacterium]|nr:KamA family radical SAM protein [Candidatus Latescibacterota bacterium]
MTQTQEYASDLPLALKPPADRSVFDHKDLRDDDYWHAIPAYADLSAGEFHDHRFQSRNSITSLRKLREVLGALVGEAFYKDVERGLALSPMSLRISPYLVSLIDW